MGFDITANDLEGNEIAYHRSYMGGFRMMVEQGYDWFNLINAEECDNGVSGSGDTKLIKLEDLKNALKILLKHKPICLASNYPGEKQDRDEFNYRKPRLKEFMEKCINCCEENEMEGISIYFG